MVMKQTTMAWLSEIYNLILHPGTRQWEREQLVQAKNTLETQLATKQKAGKNEKESSISLEDQQTRRVLEKLEASLRPLALRNNLTPNVAEFYQTISQSAPKKAMNEETLKRNELGSPISKSDQEPLNANEPLPLLVNTQFFYNPFK